MLIYFLFIAYMGLLALINLPPTTILLSLTSYPTNFSSQNQRIAINRFYGSSFFFFFFFFFFLLWWLLNIQECPLIPPLYISLSLSLMTRRTKTFLVIGINNHIPPWLCLTKMEEFWVENMTWNRRGIIVYSYF